MKRLPQMTVKRMKTLDTSKIARLHAFNISGKLRFMVILKEKDEQGISKSEIYALSELNYSRSLLLFKDKIPCLDYRGYSIYF